MAKFTHTYKYNSEKFTRTFSPISIFSQHIRCCGGAHLEKQLAKLYLKTLIQLVLLNNYY